MTNTTKYGIVIKKMDDKNVKTKSELLQIQLLIFKLLTKKRN